MYRQLTPAMPSGQLSTVRSRADRLGGVISKALHAGQSPHADGVRALNEGEDLVEDAIMRRLVPQAKVLAYPYKGYWSPADTVKERAQLEEMYHRGTCAWMIWDPERSGAARSDNAASPAPAR